MSGTTMTQPTPLHAEHLAAGATLAAVDGWLQPVDFGDPAAEYATLRAGAGLTDLSARGLLRVRGADRARFLHNLLSNDIQALRPAQGCYAAKLTVRGKMEAALRVLCLEDELRCDCEPGPAPQVFASLAKHLVRDRAQLEDESGRWALLAVHGPQAAAVLQAAGFDPAPLGSLLQHGDAVLAGIAVRVVRADHCGAGGFDVWVQADGAAPLWRALRDAGARPVGLRALDVRRIEAGMPRAGTEITGETFPMEAGLDAGWISYTKGCYLGQETISRLHYLGHVNRQLCGLLVEDGAALSHGVRLLAADHEVGWVTSTAASPALRRQVGLGYVHREHAAAGTALAAETAAGSAAVTVASLPLA
jgi:aminomethyltransferase